MNESKCIAMKAALAGQDQPQLVSIEKYFDGNDDASSIGCNLLEHPGMDTFREVLTGLLRRSDVSAVYAQIAELDPGEGCWPFADTVIVHGSITRENLSDAVSVLQPTDIGNCRFLVKQSRIRDGRSLVIWWD